jgi:drug/metabolite transporter (DMT)-like permease
MSWIFIALLSHVSWAFGNIGDKFIVTNKIKNPYIYNIWLFITGIVAIVFIPFVDFHIPNLHQLLWVVLAAIMEYFSAFPYVKAIQMEDVTRINLWWVMIPLFCLIFGYLFIGESLTNQQFIAFALLLAGTILASIKFQRNLLKFSKAFWLAVLSCFGWAIYAIIFRYLTHEMEFINIYLCTHILGFIFGIIMLCFRKIRQANNIEMKNLTLKTGLIVFGVAQFGMIGTLLNAWALSLGKVALVYSMEGFQIIFVFFLTVIFAIFTKINLHEEMDIKNLILKALATIINVCGIIMLYV